MNESIVLEEDVIQGLPLGADDDLTQPRSLNELRVRVRALLRRIDQETGPYARAHAVDRLGRAHVLPGEVKMGTRHA